MKKTKILVPALSVLALGMAAAVTGTVAWFSANNVVTANGMAFKSVTPSSLAIGKTLAADGIGQATSISWTEANPEALSPLSHWHADEDNPNGVEDQTGAYYKVKNGDMIDPETGLAALDDGAANLNSNPANATYTQYENIEFDQPTSGTGYYKDYVCYIASVGTGITLGSGGYLRAEPRITSTGNGDTIHAATVDFFVYKGAHLDSSDPENPVVVDGDLSYVQGVNELGKDYIGRHGTYPNQVTPGTTAKTTADIMTTGTIPNADGNYAIKVVMRFYFDGAFLKDATHAYVATNTLDTHDVNVTVSFTLNRGN